MIAVNPLTSWSSTTGVTRPCCMDPARDTVIPQAFVAYAIRTDSGRPSSSMRFSARTAMPTSVARRLFNVRWLAGQPVQTHMAAAHHGGERLVHFMPDRRGQLAQGYCARDVRELGLRATQRLLGT